MAKSKAARRTQGRPVPVGELLPAVAEAGGWGTLLEISRLRARWSEVVGEAVATHSVPEKLVHGRLTVLVDSSPWLVQLGFFKDDIRRKANRLLSGGVAEVFLMVGKVPDSTPHRAAPMPDRPVAESDRKEVEDCLAEVGDEEVREALRSLLLSGLRRGRRPLDQEP